MHSQKNAGRTLRDDKRLKLSLLRGALHYLGFDGVGADEPEYQHRFRLPNAMCSILRLRIHLRVL